MVEADLRVGTPPFTVEGRLFRLYASNGAPAPYALNSSPPFRIRTETVPAGQVGKLSVVPALSMAFDARTFVGCATLEFSRTLNGNTCYSTKIPNSKRHGSWSSKRNRKKT